MVVGQHRPASQAGVRRSPRRAQQQLGDRRSRGVVTLRFSARRRRRRARARRPASTSIASSVAAASSVVGPRQRPLERRAAEDLRRLHRPQLASGRASRVTRTPSAARLIVSVTGAAAIAASQPPSSSSARDAARDELGRHQRARRVVDEHDVRLGRRGRERAPRTECERSAPAGARAIAARGRRVAAPRRAARRRSSPIAARRAQRLDAPLQHRAPRKRDERLGAEDPRRSPRPAATISATAVKIAAPPLRGSDLRARPTRRAGRRGAAPPRPRPCRARTSARTRGSSSPG